MNIFSHATPPRIDPETGEVLPSDTPTRPTHNRPIPQTAFIRSSRTTLLIIFCICLNAFVITYVYITLKKDLAYISTQFDTLFLGVEESELRVTQMSESVAQISEKVAEVMGQEEEFASKNFWGDAQTATHLQSIKYLGYYELNRQRIAYTKSQLGDRFLTKNEAFNEHWRVKEINSLYLVFIGENDKTYTIHKEDY